MDTSANNVVPSPVLATKYFVEVLVLEDEWIAERRYIQLVRAIGRSRNDRTLLDFREVATFIACDCKTCGLGAFGIGNRPVDWQV